MLNGGEVTFVCSVLVPANVLTCISRIFRNVLLYHSSPEEIEGHPSFIYQSPCCIGNWTILGEFNEFREITLLLAEDSN